MSRFELDINVSDELLYEDKNFKSFFNSLRDPVIVFTLDGKILNANRAFFDETEYSVEELRETTIFDIHPKEYRLEIENVLQDIILGKKEQYYLPILKKDGEYFNVEVNITYGKWNEFNCIFGMLKNITREKRLILSLKKIFDISSMMIFVVRVKDRKIIDINETFLKNLGYEKKEVLGKTDITTKIFSNLDKFYSLFTKVLDSSFIEERFDLIKRDGGILNCIFRYKLIDIYKEQVLLSVGFTEDIIKKYIDIIPSLQIPKKKELKEIEFKNIEINAVDYKIHETDILILSSIEEAEVLKRNLNENCKVTHINNAYKALSNIISSNEVYEFVFISDNIEGMNSVEFKNAISSIPGAKDAKMIFIGKNTENSNEFNYRLKENFSQEEFKELLSRLIGKRSNFVKKKINKDNYQVKVLVVDDNEVNRKIMTKLLKVENVKLELAINGKEALDKVLKERFDIIFMDCQMPVMDGYESTQKIRKNTVNGEKAKIIAMTAYAMEGDKEKCIDSGMDDYMSKPINLDKIMGYISEVKERL